MEVNESSSSSIRADVFHTLWAETCRVLSRFLWGSSVRSTAFSKLIVFSLSAILIFTIGLSLSPRRAPSLSGVVYDLKPGRFGAP